MEAIFLIAGLVIGGVVGVYLGHLRGRKSAGEEMASARGQVSGLSAALDEVRKQAIARDEELAAVRKAGEEVTESVRKNLEAEISTLRNALEKQRIANAEVNERLDASREHFAEQKRQIEDMEKKAKESFNALSSAALKSNNEQFVTLAEAKMKPLREQLERYEKQIAELEKTRAEAYGGLNRQLKQLESGRESLSRETRQLVNALRQPGAKGKWGEIGLRNVIELSGMSSYCDFEEQVAVRHESGMQRPDMVVHLPGNASLVIDSKVNTGAYLDAVEATDDNRRREMLSKYASDVRNTAKALGGKEYWRQFDQAPEFVVMFMPGEAFFAAAISQDSKLISDAMDRGVLIASPTTLAALLMAIKHGWQQQKMAENARAIAEAGRDVYDRLCTFVSHLDGVREGIKKAATAYDKAVGSWETRMIPGVKNLKNLGADTGKEMRTLKPAESTMRSVLPLPEDEDARQVS